MKMSKLRMTLLAALAIGATACADRDPAPASGNDGVVDSAATAAADLAAATPAAPDPHDPCRLLTASEVEAVLGAPLVGPAYLSTNAEGFSGGEPDDAGDVCWYSTKEHRNVAVSAQWENAGAISSAINSHLAKAEDATKGMLKLQDGSELTGDWDEARLRGCCTLVALQGDRMVEINFGGSLASEAEIAPLANAALARLDKPLPISGRAGNAAAKIREDKRYSTTDGCTYWTAAEMAKLVGGTVKGKLYGSRDGCSIEYVTPDQRSHEFNVTITPRNGYRSFRSENASMAGFARGINADNQGVVTLRAPKAVPGPWEAAETGPVQFSAVRHDAHARLRQAGMSPETISAVIGHAFDRIDAGNKP